MVVTAGGGGSVGVSTGKPKAIDAAKDLLVDGVQSGIVMAAETATVPLSMGVIEGVTSFAITTGPKLVSTAPIGASVVGIDLVSKAIVGSDLGKEAVLVSAAGIATAGTTKLEVVGTIELISLKVGLFFGMTPTP